MAARPHPLLDRLEATRSPPSLRSTCEMILRLHWPAVTDVGDVQHDLIASLLPLCTASQLAQLEENSPHLSPYTNALWKDLCVADFVEVRKVVEDGRLPKDQEPESWRVRYGEEEQKREHKMRAILSKMRGQYSDYNLGRGTVQEIDGARQEKRRKTLQVTAARPKTLFEKAKSHTRAITSIYAPKRRPVPPAPAPPTSLGSVPSTRGAAPSLSAARAPSTSNGLGTQESGSRKKPVVTVVTRKRPASQASPPPTARADSTRTTPSRPAALAAPTSTARTPSFSPPATDDSASPAPRLIAPLPTRLPIPEAASPPPRPTSGSAQATQARRPVPSLFMPKGKRG